ncbi:MAG: acetate--CoA ligase family protein [Candidatus Micrarchaeia archaeon]|jgi:hypothetical protein
MRTLSFEETESLLEKYRLPQARFFASNDPEAIVQQAQFLEKPLVLKGLSSQVLHKTEKKMILLNLWDEREVRGGIGALSGRAADQGVSIDHFLLQEQKSGAEFIIGGKRDPSFGPVLLFGFGGIYAELLKDFAVRVCPVDPAGVKEMMRSTKAGLFFSENGFRGIKASESLVAEMLSQTARLLMENKNVVELDFNPVIASTNNASIVDARIIVD